jgi:hypothetical protein
MMDGFTRFGSALTIASLRPDDRGSLMALGGEIEYVKLRNCRTTLGKLISSWLQRQRALPVWRRSDVSAHAPWWMPSDAVQCCL